MRSNMNKNQSTEKIVGTWVASGTALGDVAIGVAVGVAIGAAKSRPPKDNGDEDGT